MPQYEPGVAEQQDGDGPGRNSDLNQFSNSNSALHAVVVDKPEGVLKAQGDESKSTILKRDEKAEVATAKKGLLIRSESDCELCRVCQQPSEESLIDLGCDCRGELAKAHSSCIEIWFRSRGSNKCEICQKVAVNVPLLDYQPIKCFSPLWVAFSILIGGLLLDVLISVSLGVSALPVNIIVGILIVLGLGMALRLAMECCHGWGSRRQVQETGMDVNLGYRPSV